MNERIPEALAVLDDVLDDVLLRLDAVARKCINSKFSIRLAQETNKLHNARDALAELIAADRACDAIEVAYANRRKTGINRDNVRSAYHRRAAALAAVEVLPK